MALADPGHGYGKSDDSQDHDSLGNVIRRAFGMDTGNDQTGGAVSQQRLPTRAETGTTGESPGQTSTKETTSTKDTTTTKETTTTKPTETTPTTTTVGQPPPRPPQSSGGGGGGAIEQLPRFKQPSVPDMQLPDELKPTEPGVPGGPGVLEAGAGAAAAPVGAAAPIALPVIVVPPLSPLGPLGAPGGIASPGTPRRTGRRHPTRRHCRAAGRPRPAARERGQQCRYAGAVVPDRIHRVSADRRTAAGRRIGCARTRRHSCSHRCRGISRVPASEGGPRRTSRYGTVHEVARTAP